MVMFNTNNIFEEIERGNNVFSPEQVEDLQFIADELAAKDAEIARLRAEMEQAVTAERERIRAGIEALINELYDRDDISYATYGYALDAAIEIVKGGEERR